MANSENPVLHRVGIIMNGVTGRMGTRQHLARSIVAIRDEGGVQIGPSEFIMPDPILVGRNEQKLKGLCEEYNVSEYRTSLDEALALPGYPLYFDAQITGRRFESVKKAIDAGKHIYCEKPTGLTLEEAMALYGQARDKGIKHGVVQDKLWLPGLMKAKKLINEGFFGKILSLRGEFGYWVFEGHTVAINRPSWNYRKENGGGIIMDMLCHWRYVLDDIFGAVKSVSCIGATHIPERLDEDGNPYKCTADDAAYSTFELEGDIIAHFNSSWATRVRRDDLLTIQIDGTKGSALVGLRDCLTQTYNETPVPVWNPDIDQPIRFFDQWKAFDADTEYENAFKAQWKLFLRHIVTDEPFPWDLLEGAKGVQLAEVGLESWHQRRWLNLDNLK